MMNLRFASIYRLLFHGLKTFFTSTLLQKYEINRLMISLTCKNTRILCRRIYVLSNSLNLAFYALQNHQKKYTCMKLLCLLCFINTLVAAVLLPCLVFLTTNMQLSLFWTACLLAKVRNMSYIDVN